MLYSAINERWTLTLATADCAKSCYICRGFERVADVRLQHSVVQAGQLLTAAEFKNWRLRLELTTSAFISDKLNAAIP
ncbi:MAG: hypothetical protein ACKERG_00180 [Candidatus Hodgkinia cicadicola]